MAVIIAPSILGANFCNMVMNADMLIGQLATREPIQLLYMPNLACIFIER